MIERKKALTEAAIKANEQRARETKEKIETEMANVNKAAQRRIDDERIKFDKERQALYKNIETAKANNPDYGAREQEWMKRWKENEEKFNGQKAIAEAAREKIEKMDEHIIEIEQSRTAIIQTYAAEMQKFQTEIAMLRLDNARLQNNFFSQAQSQSSSVFVSPLNPYIYNNNGAQLENWNEYSEQEQQPMRQPVQQTVQRPMQFSPPKPMPSADVQRSPNREESQHKEHKSFSTPANFEDLKRREEKARGPAFSTPDAQQPKKPIVILKPTQQSRSDDKRNEERGYRSERRSRRDSGKRSRDEDIDEEQARVRRDDDSRRAHSRDDDDLKTKVQDLQAQLDALKSNKPKGENRQREQPQGPPQIIRKCMHWGNGHCKNGSTCKFSHEPDDLGKTKIPCGFEEKTGKCIKDDCVYSHKFK